MDAHDEDQQTQVDDLIQMLEDVEQRLVEDAAGPAPSGLTEPDEGGTERWEAAQVWAHMAEFVAFWQAELEKVVDHYGGTPVPFGRTKDDPTRIGAIEEGRHVPIAELMRQVHDEIEVTRRYLPTLSAAQWAAVGLHSRRGEMTVPQIVERFTIDHLEEHADQLDDLA
jgi:hypothetical protein